MERVVRIFESHAEAEAADRAFYRSLSPQERLTSCSSWQHGTARDRVKLQQDLREFVGSLLSRGVDFVVVGGHAVACHGYPRMTDDIDLLVRPTRENGQRIADALAGFGFGAVGLTEDSFTAPDRVIQLGRVDADLDGLRVSMIGREALIRNKRATGRTQDLADAEKLESSD